MSTSAINTSSILQKIQDAKPALLFVGKIILIYVAWKVWLWFVGTEDVPIQERYWPWLSIQWEAFNDFVRVNLIYVSGFVLEIFGLSTTPGNYVIGIEGTSGMAVGNYCLALQLWFFFVGLVLVFPSPWKHKLWFAALGLLVIHLLNVVRVVVLGWLLAYAPEYFDFNHYYALRGAVFVAIFLLFRPYLKHFASQKIFAPS